MHLTVLNSYPHSSLLCYCSIMYTDTVLSCISSWYSSIWLYCIVILLIPPCPSIVRYALESINYGTFSSARDMWSYGVTLWVMFSFGEYPYGEWTGTQVSARTAFSIVLLKRVLHVGVCKGTSFALIFNY